MRLVVVTALWKRPNLTRLVLHRYQALREALRGQVDLDLVAVGSEGPLSRDLAVEEGWGYVEAPNKPLGAKWNALMPTVRKLDPDGMVVVGSDDWLSKRAFQFYVECINRGVPLCGFRDIYFLDGKSGKTLHFGGYTHPSRVGESLGLGRCLSREALEALDWHPWWRSLNRGLDFSMMKSLRRVVPDLKDRARIVTMQDIGACALDVKTPVGICRVRSYVGSKLPDGSPNVKWIDQDGTRKLLLKHFPRAEAENLLRYVRALRSGSPA